MENQPPPAKGGDEEIAGSMAEEDRISQLPQHILHHHILPLLPQIEAVRTCVLSKSWRYLGSTLPKFEFRRYVQDGEKLKSMPGTVLETTFQRYCDQKLSLHEFIFGIWKDEDSKTFPNLKKWIPKVLLNLGVKKLSLTICQNQFRFPLPSVIYQAEFLEELHLVQCELNQNKKICIIFKLEMLKRLELQDVYIEDETFEKMMSSCPLLQYLVLDECLGLRAIKVNKARNLKHFECYIRPRKDGRICSIEINDDAPSLETIRIRNCQNWYLYRRCYFSFPCLKSLHLEGVHLPTELLNNLSSSNCPCLEEVELYSCSGFTEFKLSNRSIKRLIISLPDSPIKAHIDAANMLYFKYEGTYIPSISFAATSRECKSQIDVGLLSDMDLGADASSTWYIKLYEFLKALSQSQIYLDTYYIPLLENQDTCGGGEPVVLEHLCLWEPYFEFNELQASLNCLFCICRPRYIGLSENAEDSHKESLLEILSNKKRKRQWQQDLEEISIEVSDKNTKEWHPIQDCALSNTQDIRIRLKWRDFS